VWPVTPVVPVMPVMPVVPVMPVMPVVLVAHACDGSCADGVLEVCKVQAMQASLRCLHAAGANHVPSASHPSFASPAPPVLNPEPTLTLYSRHCSTLSQLRP